MTKLHKKLHKAYMRKLNNSLKLKFSLNHPAYKELSLSVADYLESEPEATEADLYERFGTPEQSAAMLLEKEDLIEMIGKQKKMVLLLIPVILLLLAALIISIIIISGMYDSYGGRMEVTDAFEVGTPYVEA